MSRLILPNRFTQQPQFPAQVDSSHPDAIGLRHFWQWGAAGNALMRDSAKNAHATSLVGTGLSARQNPLVTRLGKLADFAGDVATPYGIVVPGASCSPFNTIGALSTLVIFRLLASNSLETAFWRKAGAGTGIAFDLFPNATAGSRLLRPLINTSGTTGWSASYDVPVTDLAVDGSKFQAAAFSYTSASRLTYFGDTGNLTLRDTRTAITGTLVTTDTNDMYIGGMEAAGERPFPGQIFAILIWDRVVSGDRLRALALNPMQLLQAPPRKIWLGVSGAASVGSSTGIATVAGIGAALAAATGASSGVASVTGVAPSGSVGLSTATSAATATGSSLAASSGAASCVATAAATGGAGVASVGISAGTASVAGFAQDSGSVGASAGVATASATGRSLFASVGLSACAATAAAAGASTVIASGTSAGVATAASTGAALFSATGSSAGVASVIGTGVSFFTGAGLSSGSAIVVGSGISLARSVGASTGAATVNGVAAFLAAETYPGRILGVQSENRAISIHGENRVIGAQSENRVLN